MKRFKFSEFVKGKLILSDNTSMKDNRCFICKFKQENIPKTNDDLIYDAKGNSMVVPLCYGHSVELFKTGQKSFLNLELVNYFNPSAKDRSWY